MEGQTLVSEASKGVTTLITCAEYKLIGITLLSVLVDARSLSEKCQPKYSSILIQEWQNSCRFLFKKK